MQRSRFDMRGADAGAGGMSISSGSGGASGMGASSSPSSSVSSAIAHIGGPSSSGSGAMCLAKRSSREWSAAASSTASRKAPSLWARSWRHPVLQTLPSAKMSAIARAAHSADVEELYPTPHIHEQMTAYIMATTTSTLSQTR